MILHPKKHAADIIGMVMHLQSVHLIFQCMYLLHQLIDLSIMHANIYNIKAMRGAH